MSNSRFALPVDPAEAEEGAAWRQAVRTPAFWAILVLALLLRVAFVVLPVLGESRQDYPAAAFGAAALPSWVNVQLDNDSSSYLLPARSFLDAGIFSQDAAPPYHIDVLRTPGYPLFIGTIWEVMGRQTLAPVVWVQVILSTLAVALIYIAALRLFNSRAAAMVAALFLTVDAMAAARPAYILTDSIFQVLIVVTVYFVVDFLLTNSWRSILSMVVVVTLGLYVRPVGIILSVGLAMAVLLASKRPWRGRIAQAAVVAIVPLVLLFPWSLRNHIGADTWEPSTLGSIGMLRYQGGAIKEILENKTNVEVHKELEQEVVDRLPSDYTVGQLSAMRRKVAGEYMKRYPGMAVETHLLGIARLLFLPPHWIAPPTSAKSETADADILSRIMKPLKGCRTTTLLYMAYGLCYIVVLWLLVLVGFVKLWRKGQFHRALTIVLVIAALAAPVASPAGEPRYRMPLMVPLMLLAGAAWITRKKPAVAEAMNEQSK
jgi:4-amino-4-deoxy-L-arabinose transferase-like glycosyltransferase